METRLKECIYWPMAAVALSVILVTVAPSIAQAQDQSTMVDYGESHWSISAKRLSPDATTEHVADGVKQNYALNRGLIGSDPNLIFVGQELLLPADVAEATPSVTGPRMVQLSTRRAPVTREDAETEAESPAASVESSAGRSARAARLATEPLNVSDVPAGTSVAAVMTLTTEDSRGLLAISALADYFAELRSNRRQLIGLGIIALTFVVAALMVWKLPMRRDIGYGQPWTLLPRLLTARAEAQMYSSTSYAPTGLPERAQRSSPAPREDASASAPSLLPAVSGLDSPAHGRGGSATSYELVCTARRRTRLPHRGRTRGPKRLLRGGFAVSAYRPQIRRSRRVALRNRRRSKLAMDRDTASARRVARRAVGGR